MDSASACLRLFALWTSCHLRPASGTVRAPQIGEIEDGLRDRKLPAGSVTKHRQEPAIVRVYLRGRAPLIMTSGRRRAGFSASARRSFSPDGQPRWANETMVSVMLAVFVTDEKKFSTPRYQAEFFL